MSPPSHVDRFRGGGEVVRPLVQDGVVQAPLGQSIACGNCRAKPNGERVELVSKMRFQRHEWIKAEKAFIRIVQQLTQCLTGRQWLVWLHLLT